MHKNYKQCVHMGMGGGFIEQMGIVYIHYQANVLENVEMLHTFIICFEETVKQCKLPFGQKVAV